MGFNLLCKIILSVFILSTAAANPIQTKEAADETNVVDYDEGEDIYDEPSATGNEDIYASEFPHGEKLEKYSMEKHEEKPSARSGRAHIRIVHKWAKPLKPTNYAKKYRTWKPAKEWIKPVGRKGPKRLAAGPPRAKKPSHRRNGPLKRRRVNPPRGNLQKPSPPEPDYDYLSDEEYFPEETKRNEFEYSERRPPPGKGMRKRPHKPNKEHRHVPKHEPDSVSYSNFVQHPNPSSGSIDYTDFYADETPRPKERRRRKKKRRKGERKRIRDHEEDQYGAHSESSEENRIHPYSERYPPYNDDVSHSRPLRHPLPTQPSPVYGDGYIGNQVASTKFPQGSPGLVNRGFDESSGLGRYRNDLHSGTPQTFGNQYYETTGFNNFGVSNNHPQLPQAQPDIVTRQNYQQFQNTPQNSRQQFNNLQVSQPNFNAINNLNQQVANDFNRPVNYNPTIGNIANRPTVPTLNQNAHTYQNVPTSHHEFSSRYKSNSFFDNTETFHDFNQNLGLQEEKKFGAKPGRPPNFVPSREYQENGEAENEFINQHLDLYSNGMSGVPIQGDGFGNDRRQEVRSKDYDIGYGELQYDETHAAGQ